jgi:predicted TIM-barrel fold metal-dependent hydrolase
MSGIRITNCHIHTFTARHVPSLFPHPLALPFVRVPGLVRGLAFLARAIGQHPWGNALDRLYQLQVETRATRQAQVLDRVIPQYPESTRFVVLPMALDTVAAGRIAEPLKRQHDELSDLARDPENAGRVIPFATIRPDARGAAEEVRRCIEDLGFRGLKLYPRLGYPPDHPVLMNEVYPLLVEHNLPVMSHCSRGGVTGRQLTRAKAEEWSAPQAFLPVLEAFPTLRVCLAHFGGESDWRAYVEHGIDPRDPAARPKNWQVAIRDMLTCGQYPNLWTDISYTLFHFEDFVPFLQVFLQDEAVARRVLFGSDFYMTRQEELSERAVCFRLRVAMGEALFRQIAETNPEVWLGERPEPA